MAVAAAVAPYVSGLLSRSTPRRPGPDAIHGPYDSVGRLLSPATSTKENTTIPALAVAAGMSRNDALALVGRKDGTLQLWNPVTRRALSSVLAGHDRPVYSVALHGSTAVSAGTDHSLRVWDLTTGRPASFAMDERLDAGLNGVALCVVGGRTVAVTAADDHTMRVWDPAHPGRRSRILGSRLDAAVQSVAVGTVGGRAVAVSGSADGGIRLWDVSGERLIRLLGAHKKAVWGLAVGTVRGRPVAVSGGEDGVVRRWDLDDPRSAGGTLADFTPEVPVKTVAIGESGGRTIAIAGCDDNKIHIWDLDTGLRYGDGLTGPDQGSQSIAISNLAGRPTVVSGHYDGTVWTWVL